jgi:DNA-binding response OmpR family regulator
MTSSRSIEPHPAPPAEPLKVLFLGLDRPSLDKVQLAIRLRWPHVMSTVERATGEGIGLIERDQPDIVFVQHAAGMGFRTAASIVQEIRWMSDVAVVVIERPAAQGSLDEVQSLESGADDYVKANATVVQIVARLVALRRRVRRQTFTIEDQAVRYGGLLLVPATYEASVNGVPLTLTSKEFQLLHLLAKHRGTVVTHRVIEMALWGEFEQRTGAVKKYISRLRAKFGGASANGPEISNLIGIGYRLIVRGVES